jgi:DNA repair protein RAD7
MAPKRRAAAAAQVDSDDSSGQEDQPLALDDALPPPAAAAGGGTTASEEDDEPAAAAAPAARRARPPPAAATTDRRQAMANVARRRAAHFAHFDPDNDQLVGPRPARRRRGNGDDEEEEEQQQDDDDEDGEAGDDDGNGVDPHTGAGAEARQLGPWASAAQLDRARGRAALRRAAKLREAAVEGAKAAREAAQLWQPRSAAAGNSNSNALPTAPIAAPAGAVPRLASLALRVIADHIDDVESLWGLPCALRHDIAAELARRRALTDRAAMLLAEDRPRELVLPDCTLADARCAQRLAREAGTDALERLDLGFCGRGFGDEAVGSAGLARGGRGSLPRLQHVRLAGAYRLSDAALVALLEAAGGGGGGGGPAEDDAAAAASDQQGGAGGEFDYEGGAAFAAALAGEEVGGGGSGGNGNANPNPTSTGLLSLALPQCPRLEGPFLRRLPDLAPRLARLDLTDCRALPAAALRQALAKLPRLAALSLDGVPEADERVIVEGVAGGAAARAGALREVSLRGCSSGVTDASLAALAACASAGSLEMMRLDECHAFADAGLASLTSSLRSLREISLRRCSPSLTDAALADLITRASSGTLSRAVFSGLQGAGPLLARAVARAGASTLEALDVSFCRAMPEEALGLIADNCPALAELRVFGCSQITRKLLHGHRNARLASGEGLLEGGGGGAAGLGRSALGGGVGGTNRHGGVIGVGTFVVYGGGLGAATGGGGAAVAAAAGGGGA